MQPVHQGQQLRDQPLFRFARSARTLGCDGIDLVDEDDGWGGLGRFLEHVAQALFAFAIGRAHDFRAVDGKETGVAFIRHGAGQAGLARSRRAVEQHALGRIDAQAGKQFGIAQRQFHHLAQLADRVAHAADVVVIDITATGARFLEFLAQFDFGVLVDVHDPLRRGRNHGQADLGKRKGGHVEHPGHFRRHVADLLLPGRGNDVARHQGAAKEVALERLSRPLQAHFLLRRGKDHALRRPAFRLAHLNVIARAGFGIAALQAVKPDHVQPFVLGIGGHDAGRGGALALDLDHIAFRHAKGGQRAARQPGKTVAAFFLAGGGNLQPYRGNGGNVGHESPILL